MPQILYVPSALEVGDIAVQLRRVNNVVLPLVERWHRWLEKTPYINEDYQREWIAYVTPITYMFWTDISFTKIKGFTEIPVDDLTARYARRIITRRIPEVPALELSLSRNYNTVDEFIPEPLEWISSVVDHLGKIDTTVHDHIIDMKFHDLIQAFFIAVSTHQEMVDWYHQIVLDVGRKLHATDYPKIEYYLQTRVGVHLQYLIKKLEDQMEKYLEDIAHDVIPHLPIGDVIQRKRFNHTDEIPFDYSFYAMLGPFYHN